MKKALISVLRLIMLVGALVVLPYINTALKAQFTHDCQTYQPEQPQPCPSCCPTQGAQIYEIPFSNGPGIYSLQPTPYSCGTQPATGCPVSCSGTSYPPVTDSYCCVAEGGSCSVDAQCCTTGDTCFNGVCTATTGGGGAGASGGGGIKLDCGGNCSPIILDTDGRGFFLTNAQNGVSFDITGDGVPIQMAWTASGSTNAFLALPAADGLVHSGKQLFGNFTPQPPSATPNGFAALAVYDLPANGGNGDGIIDSRDAIYPNLRLWIDTNHDGISQPEELHTLSSLGVVSISLNYTLSRRVDQYGNVFRYKAVVDPNDPDPTHVGKMAYDVFFVTLTNTASASGPSSSDSLVAEWDLARSSEGKR